MKKYFKSQLFVYVVKKKIATLLRRSHKKKEFEEFYKMFKEDLEKYG
jgi:hypothetical protein